MGFTFPNLFGIHDLAALTVVLRLRKMSTVSEQKVIESGVCIRTSRSLLFEDTKTVLKNIPYQLHK